MSTYPRRVSIIENGSLGTGTTYYDSPQIAFQPFGRLTIGYTFTTSASGTISLSIEHKGPDGVWYAPQDPTVVTTAAAPSASTAVIDSYALTWGTNIRWKLVVGTGAIAGLYIWVDFA